MIDRHKKRLGEILVEEGVLTRESLEEALNHQKEHGGLIGQILISLGYTTEEEVVAALTAQLGIPYLPVANYSVNMDAAELLEEDFCRRNLLVPFDHDEKRIFVVVADPLNEGMLKDIESKSNLRSQLFISTTTEIMNMLELIYSSKSQGDQQKNGS